MLPAAQHALRAESNFVAPKPRQGPTADEWRDMQGVVQQLYVTQKRPLKEVRVILARDYNFRATERMYKTRLSQWGFSKNARADDYEALAVLHKTRRDAGKTATEFLVRGRRKTVADLRAHIRSKNMSDDEFLSASLDCTVPPHIRCYTPDPGGTLASPLQSPNPDRPTPLSATSSLESQLTPSSHSGPSPSPSTMTSATSAPPQPSSILRRAPTMSQAEHWHAADQSQPEVTCGEDFVLISDPSRSILDSSCSCDQVQQDIRTMALQVIKPAPLMSRHGAEDVGSWILLDASPASGNEDRVALCAKCNRPLAKHFVSLDGLAPSTRESRSLLRDSDHDAMTLPSTTDVRGEAWRWMAYCFGACIQLSSDDSHLSKHMLDFAAAEFEQMLANHDSLTLTALDLMLVILHVHDQGRIAESIVQSALGVAQRVLNLDDPIRITVQWMMAVAGQSLGRSGSNGEQLAELRRIHQRFHQEQGEASPSTLAALYHVAWMLNYEGLFVEAETSLKQLYEASSATLGPTHMQSITALTTLSRAQERQGNYVDAMENMTKAIGASRSTLGRSHPHRLESKRRLALMYEKTGQKDRMEDLYWDVLKGRIKMLGAHHPYTTGARTALTNLLKDLGKWKADDSTQWLIDELFTNASPTTSQHEAF